MEISSPRFKALAVTAGFSLWFFIITGIIGIFSIENFAAFIIAVIIVTQIFAKKLSHVLDSFAILNTKIFLGLLFVTVFSLYGILFKMLRIDLLRLQNQNNTYWLNMEQLKPDRLSRQY